MIRNFFRWMLGLPSMEDAYGPWDRIDEKMTVLIHDMPSLTMFKAMEQKQAERHKEIMESLARIEAKPIRPRVTPINPSTWEEIQAAYAANPRNFEESA